MGDAFHGRGRAGENGVPSSRQLVRASWRRVAVFAHFQFLHSFGTERTDRKDSTQYRTQ